jgi:hypothetical protein
VEVEVEIRVVHPVRMVQTERNLGQFPAVDTQHVEALFEGPVEVGKHVVPVGGLDDDHRRHVAELGRGLHVQEAGVEP